MKNIKAINAELQGAVQRLKYGFSLYSKELKAFHRMEVAQRKHFHITTALLQDMKNNAELEQDIEDDLKRRLDS